MDDEAFQRLILHGDIDHLGAQQHLDMRLVHHFDDDALHRFGIEGACVLAPVGFANAPVGTLVADAAVDHLVENAAVDQAGRFGEAAAGDKPAQKTRGFEQERLGAFPRCADGGHHAGRASADHHHVIVTKEFHIDLIP